MFIRIVMAFLVCTLQTKPLQPECYAQKPIASEPGKRAERGRKTGIRPMYSAGPHTHKVRITKASVPVLGEYYEQRCV